MSSAKQSKKKGKGGKKEEVKMEPNAVKQQIKKQEQVIETADKGEEEKVEETLEESQKQEDVQKVLDAVEDTKSEEVKNETMESESDNTKANETNNQDIKKVQQEKSKPVQQQDQKMQVHQEVPEEKYQKADDPQVQEKTEESAHKQQVVLIHKNVQKTDQSTQKLKKQQQSTNYTTQNSVIELQEQPKQQLSLLQQLPKPTRQKSSQSPQPITLIDSTGIGSNQDLDLQSTKQIKTKKSDRLAKFKQKQKKVSAPKNQQKSPQHQKPTATTEPKKHLISSTVSTIKSKFTRTHHDIEQLSIEKDMDEYKMLLVMIQSKKKQNYKTLKEWDDKRIEALSLHLNVADGFERTLDNLARTSFENIEIYFSTFRQIYNQQEKYASHPMIDTAFITKHNLLSQNIYINCSCILNALNEESLERAKKARLFGQFIKTNILEAIFDIHLKKSQHALTQIKTKISALKSVLINTQVESDKRSQKLAQSFANNLMQLEENKDQDFYELQLDFLRLSHQIVEIHKQYAELILEYFEVVRDIEVERAAVIKKAIKVYSQAIEANYQSKTGYESLEQLSKGEESLLINEFFQVQQLIPVNYQQSIKQKQNVTEQGFKLQTLQDYFKNFKVEPFDLRQLILKQYTINNQTTAIQNSTLIITVDKFIHVFSSLQNYTQAAASYKINDLLRVKRKGNQVTIEVLPEKRSGVLGMFGWSPKGVSSLMVMFQKKDNAEEAEDWVKKLI